MDTDRTTDRKEQGMILTKIACPCGCGATVTMQDGGFAATYVEVTACADRRAAGIVTMTYRKSALAIATVATVRHTDALVEMEV